jgi:hypothetical protein
MKGATVCLVIALTSLLEIGGVGTHATTPAAADVDTATGGVVSSDGSLLVLELDSGVRRQFVTSDTTLMPTDFLRIGDRVSVKYRPGLSPAEVLELAVLSRASLDTWLDCRGE